MGKKNPILQKKFEEGLTQGFAKGWSEGKASAVARFAVRAERLPDIKGIGKVLIHQIENALFLKDLDDEEIKRAEMYYQDLIIENRKREQEWKKKRS